MKGNSFRTILFVSLDAFFASVEQALNPALRGTPVVVSGNLKSRTIVACSSYQARQLGITHGQSLAEAYQRGPQATFVEGSFGQYEKFSEEFYKILARFSEYIEPVSLDEAYVELIGFEKQWINPEQVAYEIQKTIVKELEIPVSIGIASNKVTARAAARSKKPNGIAYVAWGHEKSFLDPLPVINLPSIGVRTAEVLAEYNVTTIGQLANQPITFVDEIFGSSSRWLWQLAQGVDARPVTTPGKTQTVSRSQSFPFATQDVSVIKKALDTSVASACSSIRTTRQVGSIISVAVTTHWGQQKFKQITLGRPTNSSHEILVTAEGLLDELLTHYAIVSGVQVMIKNLKRHDAANPLFTLSFYKLKKIRESVSILQQRFGFVPSYATHQS